jgi:hypothetical protein
MVSKKRGPGAVVGNTEAPKKKKALIKSKPDNSQTTCRAQRKNPRSPEAVDALQEHGVKHGLVAEIGQHAVQWIISEAFSPVRAGEVL